MCNICKAITYKYILMFIQTFKKYIYIFFTVGLFESCSKPMCKDLESVIQSEVSQKEKNKYRILRHICGIQKNGTGEPICRAGIETQTQRMDVWAQGEERGE